MTKIMFVCHGNICRSPMAEFIFRYIAKQRGVEACFEVASAAVSDEESGNDINPPAKEVLRRNGIPFQRHYAREVDMNDYNEYDLFVVMDDSNYRNLKWSFNGDPKNKIIKLFEDRQVADPWWTGDYDTAYRDIYEGAELLLERLINDQI